MSERFIVKQAVDMVAGEPCTSSGIPNRWTLEQAEERVRGWCADLNAGRGPAFLHWEAWNTRPLGFVPLWGIVDTHDAWHTARVEAPKDPRRHRWNHDPVNDRYHCLCGVTSQNPPSGLTEMACEIAWQLYAERAMPTCSPKPSGPTDAEIVAQYEKTMQDGPLHGVGWVTKDITQPRNSGHWFLQVPHAGMCCEVSEADVRAAWSRELKRKQAEARDKERHRVICEDQYEL